MSEPLKNTPLYARLRLAETLLEQVYRQVGKGSAMGIKVSPRLSDSIEAFLRLPKIDAREDAANRKRLEMFWGLVSMLKQVAAKSPVECFIAAQPLLIQAKELS